MEFKATEEELEALRKKALELLSFLTEEQIKELFQSYS